MPKNEIKDDFTKEQKEWFRINQKFEKFNGKILILGTPEYEEHMAIESELYEFIEKHCTTEAIDTPDKLMKWIGQELIFLDMAKMDNGRGFQSYAKKSYQKARDYALELRTKNPNLLHLPDVLSDSLMGLKSMKEWCIEAQNVIDIISNLQSDLHNSKPFGFHSKRSE